LALARTRFGHIHGAHSSRKYKDVANGMQKIMRVYKSSAEAVVEAPLIVAVDNDAMDIDNDGRDNYEPNHDEIQVNDVPINENEGAHQSELCPECSLIVAGEDAVACERCIAKLHPACAQELEYEEVGFICKECRAPRAPPTRLVKPQDSLTLDAYAETRMVHAKKIKKFIPKLSQVFEVKRKIIFDSSVIYKEKL